MSGVELQRLLELVSSDGHLDISRALLVLLGKRDADAVDFGAFAAAVQSCLLYHELFAEAERMFAACDVHGTGRVRRSVLAVVQASPSRAPPTPSAPSKAARLPPAAAGGVRPPDRPAGAGGGRGGELRKLDGAEAAAAASSSAGRRPSAAARRRAAADERRRSYTLHAFVAVFAATIADGATAEAACQVLGVPDVPPEVAHTLSENKKPYS